MHQVFTQHWKKEKLMHQFFNICRQMVSCWFMLLLLNLPLLDIYDQHFLALIIPLFQKISFCTGYWMIVAKIKISDLLYDNVKMCFFFGLNKVVPLTSFGFILSTHFHNFWKDSLFWHFFFHTRSRLRWSVQGGAL